MSKTEYSRILVKRSTQTGVEPTIPSTPEIDNTWLDTDLLIGEMFINAADDRLWFRSSNGINEMVVGDTTPLNNRIIVRTASDFGVIESDKEYFLDGIIDMTGVSIEIPAGGIHIKGYDFNTSGLTCSDSAYTMFTSPAGGSGDVIFTDFHIEVDGTGSEVFDLVGDTGNEAIELTRINYNNCASLGTIDTYRQGLETGTGRFGGKPELTLKGTWSGGFRVETSIVRGILNGAYTLFKAGTGFTMASRFKTNINADLNTNVSLLDFSSSNFPNASTLQLQDCIITRSGVIDAGDSTLVPNITASALPCSWSNNQGINNTFVGGQMAITTEQSSIVASAGTFVDLAGTYTASDLQHFDMSTNGQLKHLGNSPREFKVTVNAVLVGQANHELDLKVVIYDSSAATFSDGKKVRRVVNNLIGGRNVAYFTFVDNIVLDVNDYLKFQVTNITSSGTIKGELSSEFIIEAR